MSRLASLFIAFKQVPGAEQCHVTDASSMLVRSHFSVLEEAITSDVPTVTTTQTAGPEGWP